MGGLLAKRAPAPQSDNGDGRRSATSGGRPSRAGRPVVPMPVVTNKASSRSSTKARGLTLAVGATSPPAEASSGNFTWPPWLWPAMVRAQVTGGARKIFGLWVKQSAFAPPGPPPARAAGAARVYIVAMPPGERVPPRGAIQCNIFQHRNSAGSLQKRPSPSSAPVCCRARHRRPVARAAISQASATSSSGPGAAPAAVALVIVIAGQQDQVGLGGIGQRHHLRDLGVIDEGRTAMQVADHRDIQAPQCRAWSGPPPHSAPGEATQVRGRKA